MTILPQYVYFRDLTHYQKEALFMRHGIDFFTRYDRIGASSRYRYYMYFDRLQKEGRNDVRIDNFFPESYLIKLYQDRQKSKKMFLKSLFKRFHALCHASDQLIIEYELLPFVPYFIERLFLRNRRYILNFDDNVYDKYKNIKFLKNKFDHLIRGAAGVIVANNFLQAKVAPLNSNVIKIPTVVDLDVYRQINVTKFEKFSLVWIGTPVTYKYLEAFAPIWQELSAKIDFELVVIATKKLEERAIKNVKMRFFDWSPDTEIAILKRSHVGIMPLCDDGFSNGKSAFKLIQYQAAGLPVIGSGIGENNVVIKPNLNGFIANTPEEWIQKVELLYNDHHLCGKMANTAGTMAYEYSFEKYYPRFESFLKQCFYPEK